MNFKCCLLLLLFAPAAFGADEFMRKVSRLITEGKRDEAMEMLNQAIDKNPKDANLYFGRGRLQSTMDHPDLAIKDFDRALSLTNFARIYHERGVAQFKLGRFNQAIADFDRMLKMLPEQEPEYWQRGIAYYYAGEYERGRKQFELHQTVNPYDVENAVWHYLCVARLQGADKARVSLIPIERDPRVPMKEIHALYAGKAKPEDVLAAAKARHELFYAHLYLGLYYETEKDIAEAREHIEKAAKDFYMNNFMGDVARIEAKLLSKAP